MSIHLGYDDAAKQETIAAYRATHDVRKVFVIAPAQFPLALPGAEWIEYNEVIMYRTFYRLLQEIDRHTLIVINECLRTQDRYCLTYNCIRQFLNQTEQQIIFQHLPQIDTCEDFMALFDFDTRSRWKRRRFDPALVLDNSEIHVRPCAPTLRCVDVPTSTATQTRYAKERERMFAELGARDPHILPRQLYLIGGKDKAAYIARCAAEPPRRYVARNKRLGRPDIVTYEQVESGCAYGIVELPHRFLDFSDFLNVTRQTHCDVLCADLKVDRWYFDRYTDWSKRLDATYASLS